ncbi:MAG: pyrroloquinoline quinone-dependent dehydrogenase [Gemmatimonadales bacterium]
MCLLALPLAAQGSDVAGAPPPSLHTTVTPEMLLNAQQSGDWLMYGGNYWNTRFSPLTQINTTNVKNMVPRMVFQTGTERLGSFETTPIAVNGVLYVTTPAAPNNEVIAYDLRTAKTLWRYTHKNGTSIPCCGPNNRGVAIGNGMVYVATLDAQLVALDQQTGKVRWTSQSGDASAGYSQTMAPLLIGDKVILGTSGAEYGIRGFVDAYNANTGARMWRWYTIPAPNARPDEGGVNGWFGRWVRTTPEGDNLNRDIAKEKADSAKYADAWMHGGGSMWMTPAYDDSSKTLYVGTGNPSPDLDGTIRPGDNLWTESIVALDANTGRFKWGYQTVPHDVWDLDAVSPPVIAMVGGRKAVVHAGKTGWVYVLDAATGRLIRKTDAFVPQENMFALPTPEGTRMLPGANGGQEWSPITIHPELQYAYTVGLHQPMHYKTHYAPWEKGRLWLGSAFVAIPGEEQWGNVSAVNLQTGKIAWQVKTDEEMIGGATATAGGLVFTGEQNGWFKAYDARTGAVLWQFFCGAGVNAAPSVFQVDGEQFIAVAAGGNAQVGSPLGDAIFIFGLPKTGM